MKENNTEYVPATKAISYLRYSTKKQAAGGSEKRQKEWVDEYCESNGLELVDTYKDLGISAHRGKHSKEGKLADLIKDCESGKIPKGYALIVENFDRLSREEVPIALQRFLALINEYQLEIHTLDDNCIYSSKKMDLTQLIISIVIMGRAHSESERKSVLISKAWQQARKAGKAYSKPGKRPMVNHPKWLDWDSERQEWVLRAEAVASIKYIFKLAIDSRLGSYRIAQRLQEENVFIVSKSAKKWSAAMVTDIIKNRALLGEWIPRRTKDKSAQVVENYYPVVISPDVFEKGRMGRKSRNNFSTGRPVIANHQYSILTGIGWFFGGEAQ